MQHCLCNNRCVLIKLFLLNLQLNIPLFSHVHVYQVVILLLYSHVTLRWHNATDEYLIVNYKLHLKKNIQSPKLPLIQVLWHDHISFLLFQTLNGLSEESSTEHLEFPLLTQRSLSSITQLVPFFRTLCCSFQGSSPCSPSMPHFPAADYPPSNADTVLKRLEYIIEEEFLDSVES